MQLTYGLMCRVRLVNITAHKCQTRQLTSLRPIRGPSRDWRSVLQLTVLSAAELEPCRASSSGVPLAVTHTLLSGRAGGMAAA